MRRFRKLAVAVAGGLAATVLAACGGGSTATGGPSGTLTISNESGGLWTCGFNPFNSAVSFVSFGNVYESLMYVDTLQNAKVTPMLASDYKWSNGNKTLTFTIRDGVKWSDGQSMSAADVLYTFNMLKKNSANDINSVWAVLDNVQQSGANQVVFTFKTAAVPYFYYIADQVPIVAQHVWSKVADPVKYDDKAPVGTGPYTMNQCTPQTITYTANKDYWQPGLPKVQKVLYPAFTSNDPANNYLATGQAQWGGQFIPNIDAFYAKKSPDHHYWFPPYSQVSLFPNLKSDLLGNVTVRKALAYAIDRNKASSIGEYSYEPAANQMGVVTPTFSNWVDPAAKAANDYTYNPTKAASLLTGAGYHKGADGIFVSPAGKRLSFHVINVSGNSDWVAALKAVADSAKAAGFELITDNLSSQDYDNKLYNGQFDLGYYSETAGPTPYYEYRQWLYSQNSAPIGQTATTNFERYMVPSTDSLFDEYAATTDSNRQHQIIGQLQQIMLNDVPIIPVTEAVAWFQYDTSKFSGWPTPDNPYAVPAPYLYPDWGQVLSKLQPK